MNIFRIIFGEGIIFVAGIISLIFWHKKIDSEDKPITIAIT